MLEPIDQTLLTDLQRGLAVPFADPVRVGEGASLRAVPRCDARSMERMLLKLNRLSTRAQTAPSDSATGEMQS